MPVEIRSSPTATVTVKVPSVDNRVCEAIRQMLQQSSYREVRMVSCSFHEGVAVLRGKVSSFYFKQAAQELVRRLDGVDQVVNLLSVRGCGKQ